MASEARLLDTAPGCGHLPGTVLTEVHAPDAFDHPATWCPHCHVWVRHPAYPPPKETHAPEDR